MNRARPNAFTLIETIAVIAAIAALAAALLVPMIRRLDDATRQKEANTLATMAAAYKERVATTRIIPNETGWAAAVAAVTGQQLSVITANDRGLARIFLIDPALRIGNSAGATLTYTQRVTGHVFPTTTNSARPVSPRLMIVSSCAAPLPTNLVSGVGASSGAYSFNNLWGTSDGSIPTGWTWSGRADDLKIQRIDLSDMFVQVALNNRDLNLLPRYVISAGASGVDTNTVDYGCRFPMYFLKGSEIRLLNVPGVVEYSEILFQSKSFTFEKGTWQAESYIAIGVGQPTPMDLQRAFNLFMAAPTNAYANAGATQTTVSNAVMGYLTNYIAWRNAGYPLGGGGKPPKELEDAQTLVRTTMADLIDYR
jgi:type II secretory pathway pseudopilin PulG